MTKFGSGQVTVNSVGNAGFTGQVTVNQGTLVLRSGIFGGAAVGALNGQDVYLTGNNSTLILDGGVANNLGTYSLLAFDSRATTNLGANVFVTGDSTLTSFNTGGTATSVRQIINNLTFANSGPALGAQSTITLTLGSNIEVLGTTTLIQGAVFTSVDTGNNSLMGSTLTGQVTGVGPLVKFGNSGRELTLASGTNNYTGGTVVHGSLQGQAPNLISSSARTGTPFGAGDITVYPGGADSYPRSVQHRFERRKPVQRQRRRLRRFNRL
ncbi:MAG: hypothetical protein QM775_13190 [Pirellulales bacterium]